MQHTNNKAGSPSHGFGERGQTIIEATIALASILLTLAAIAVAISISINNSQFVKQQSQASKYAQDGMEQLRYERNTNPSSFFSKSGTWCLGESSSHTGSCNAAINPDDIIDGQFKREAEFSTDGIPTECGNDKKVTVSVYWASGKCKETNTFCHKSQLVSCFVNQSGSSSTL